MLRTRSRGPARAVMTALLLCVLAMRVIVPQGFMWSSDAGGAPRIIFCSGAAPLPAVAAAALAAQHHGEHDGKTIEHPCAFAAASAAIDLAGVLHPLAVTSMRADAPTALYLFARPGLGLAAPPPPKTGPPLRA